MLIKIKLMCVMESKSKKKFQTWGADILCAGAQMISAFDDISLKRKNNSRYFFLPCQICVLFFQVDYDIREKTESAVKQIHQKDFEDIMGAGMFSLLSTVHILFSL